MQNPLLKLENQPSDRINELEMEIALLENELEKAETALNGFTSQIRSQLQPQILRIQELTEVYKRLKAAKKAKRLEQKKKGKNYSEPKAIKKTTEIPDTVSKTDPQSRQELKRLYKEAIRHVHPDKFANDEAAKSEKATEVTRQLIGFYETGDLEELRGFYEHIISGNAMSHLPYKPETISDPAALLVFLRKKREELAKALQEIKTSELFLVLATYQQPLTFIPELRLQFEQKIAQLEKRTRKGKIS